MKGLTSLPALVLIGWIALAPMAKAQPAGNLIPTIGSAESVFSTAIQAYEDQDYSTAARLFGIVANTFDFHRKTTASLLMRGKSFYMNREYAQARQVLENLISTYPTSRYIKDAEETILFATDGTDTSASDSQILRLGIALPLDIESSAFTQQLFNGIRMAVEDHNAASYDSLMGPTRKIKMIFEDTQNKQNVAQTAIRSLAEEGVDAIIGPLFSNEAIAAASVAERERIVMITPLATDDAVSRGMRYTFQANPSIATRGRLMARFSVYGLGLNEIGIIKDNNEESLIMARAFKEELDSLDANLVFNQTVTNSRTWFRLLPDGISRDTLAKADAIYLPINGGNAANLIGGALTSLDRMGFGSRLRLLGNVEWHNISQVSLAGNYSTTYSNDFYVNPTDSTAILFAERYESQAGDEPSQFVYIGYDVATFLAQQLDRQVFESRPLEQLIHEAPLFVGYGNRLDFSKGNVNEAMFYHQYKDGLTKLIR